MRCHVIVAILDNSKIAEVVLTEEIEPLCMVPPIEWVTANQTGASASKVVESEGTTAEADVDPNLFDNEEECVGVDDEPIYMPVPPTSAVDTENVSAKPTTSQPSAQAPESSHANTTACPESNENGPAAKDENGSAAKGGLPLEAEVNDADPQRVQCDS